MAKRKKKGSSRRGKVTGAKKGVSKSKQMRAGNSCCPIIHVACKPVTATKKEFVSTGDYGYEKVTKVATGVKRCKVTVGRHVYGKGFKLSNEQAGKKIASIKKALEAKRCNVLVQRVGK